MIRPDPACSGAWLSLSQSRIVTARATMKSRIESGGSATCAFAEVVRATRKRTDTRTDFQRMRPPLRVFALLFRRVDDEPLGQETQDGTGGGEEVEGDTVPSGRYKDR